MREAPLGVGGHCGWEAHATGMHAYMHAGVASVAVDMSSHIFTYSIPLIGMLKRRGGVSSYEEHMQ